MTTLLLSLLVLSALAAVVTALAVRHAPEGYEDETGFHAVRTARVHAPAKRRVRAHGSVHGKDLAGGLA